MDDKFCDVRVGNDTVVSNYILMRVLLSHGV